MKDGFATAPELWPYSNFAEWIGTHHSPLMDHEFIDAMYPSRAQYKQSVIDYLSGQHKLPPGLVRYMETLYESDGK